MNKRNLYFTLVVATVLFSQCVIMTEAQAVSNHKLERRAFKQINQHRRSEDLHPLKWNVKVAKIARIHSKHMASGRVEFGHAGFNKRYQKIQNQIPNVQSVGENVAYTTVTPGTAKHVVQLWLGSAGHLANIETPEFNVSGMGVGKKGRYYYFTQIFVYKQ